MRREAIKKFENVDVLDEGETHRGRLGQYLLSPDESNIGRAFWIVVALGAALVVLLVVMSFAA